MTDAPVSNEAREAAEKIMDELFPHGMPSLDTWAHCQDGCAVTIQAAINAAVAPVEDKRDQNYYELRDYMAALDRQERRTKEAERERDEARGSTLQVCMSLAQMIDDEPTLDQQSAARHLIHSLIGKHYRELLDSAEGK